VKHFYIPEDATPLTDYSRLKLPWVQTMVDLNRVESENIMTATQKFLRNKIDDPRTWFDLKTLRTVHRAMFGEVWEWAGSYRTSITSIGVRPHMIPAQLSALCSEVCSWSEHPVERTFVEMAAYIHHQLVLIHPFENGNGRFSRLIADRFLLAWQCPHPVWPSNLTNTSSDRSRYIQALRNADGGDTSLLITLTKEFGARDPTICDLLASPFYQERLSEERLVMIVKALLRNNADPYEPSSTGTLPLDVAKLRGQNKVAALLIQTQS
jgi:Fic-DOC domain mobile mystery protein B